MGNTKKISSYGVPSDMMLELIVEPRVENLERNYFTSSITMNLYIEENSTRQSSYNIVVIPMGSESALYGVSVPFGSLKHEYPTYSLELSSSEWITWHKYSHSDNFRIPIASKFLEWFPGDFYLSSTVYVWFDSAFYPQVSTAPTSSVPRGFVLEFTRRRFVESTHFYQNILPITNRIGRGMPKNDVLAFKVLIHRDFSSISLYFFYIIFILCFVFEILAISHLRIKKSSDRLKIFSSIAIASVAFLWSIRQVAYTITWSELVLELIIIFWLIFEIRNTAHA